MNQAIPEPAQALGLVMLSLLRDESLQAARVALDEGLDMGEAVSVSSSMMGMGLCLLERAGVDLSNIVPEEVRESAHKLWDFYSQEPATGGGIEELERIIRDGPKDALKVVGIDADGREHEVDQKAALSALRDLLSEAEGEPPAPGMYL